MTVTNRLFTTRRACCRIGVGLSVGFVLMAAVCAVPVDISGWDSHDFCVVRFRRHHKHKRQCEESRLQLLLPYKLTYQNLVF